MFTKPTTFEHNIQTVLNQAIGAHLNNAYYNSNVYAEITLGLTNASLIMKPCLIDDQARELTATLDIMGGDEFKITLGYYDDTVRETDPPPQFLASQILSLIITALDNSISADEYLLMRANEATFSQEVIRYIKVHLSDLQLSCLEADGLNQEVYDAYKHLLAEVSMPTPVRTTEYYAQNYSGDYSVYETILMPAFSIAFDNLGVRVIHQDCGTGANPIKHYNQYQALQRVLTQLIGFAQFHSGIPISMRTVNHVLSSMMGYDDESVNRINFAQLAVEHYGKPNPSLFY